MTEPEPTTALVPIVTPAPPAVVPPATATIIHMPHSGPMFTADQVEVLRRMYFAGCTDDEVVVCLAICERTRLNPFARQIYFVKRNNKKAGREELSPQVSIDGFRLVAQRSGKYRGQEGPWWCGEDGQWKDVWVHDYPPAAARVGVLHEDFDRPVYAVARFRAYCEAYSDGNLKGLWKKMPDLMIAKCAEALALRKAFPMELSGLYTDDEMAQADNGRDERRERRTQASAEANAAAGATLPKQSETVLKLLGEQGRRTGLSGPAFSAWCKANVEGYKGFKWLTDGQLGKIVAMMKRMPDASVTPASPASDAPDGESEPDDSHDAAAGAEEADAAYWAERDAEAEAALAAGGRTPYTPLPNDPEVPF